MEVKIQNVVESTTNSNFSKVTTTHAVFNLYINFDDKTIVGDVEHTLLKLDPSVKELVLDTKDLIIISCSEEYSLDQAHPVLGSALRIKLNEDTTRVKIAFKTTTKSSSVQFLNPEQTADKTHPYLFTHSCSIRTRSFFPCQDTPSVRTTYTAKVTVPTGLVALMNGKLISSSDSVYEFVQKTPISSFLIALAVGKFESKDLSPRARVWTESSLLDSAAYEFANIEEILRGAEQLCGDYPYERHDLLILPPSAPLGTMQNPELTFLSSSLLVGDRSLVSALIQSVFYSWFGSLLSITAWRDYWLSTGFGTFLERKLLKKEQSLLKSVLGKRNWRKDVERCGPDSELTKLRVNMDGIDSDSIPFHISYEKGCAFLEHIEQKVGGRLMFEPFLKDYVRKYSYGLINVECFQSLVEEKFPSVSIDWNLWIYGSGIPEGADQVEQSSLVTRAEEVVDTKVVPDDAKEWCCDQQCVMLDKLLDISFDDEFIWRLNCEFKFSESKNPEIKYRWFLVTLHTKVPDYGHIATFLAEYGRLRFIRPVYKELYKLNKPLAISIFNSNKYRYHPIAQKILAVDLGL